MKNKKESILVIPRAVLEGAGLLSAVPGVLQAPSLDAKVTALVNKFGCFFPRDEMEIDETYKQIIPYMLFTHQKKVFVMQRSSGAGEQRLAGAYTIGIGGHVRETDCGRECDIFGRQIQGGALAVELALLGEREFNEEIAYEGWLGGAQLIGLVNDDTNPVGRVHIGLVYVLRGPHDQISVRSELASGRLMDRDECFALRGQMETWSQFALDALIAADGI